MKSYKKKDALFYLYCVVCFSFVVFSFFNFGDIQMFVKLEKNILTVLLGIMFVFFPKNLLALKNVIDSPLRPSEKQLKYIGIFFIVFGVVLGFL
jgi:uncharacterized protein YjeT (DUF2065 family)